MVGATDWEAAIWEFGVVVAVVVWLMSSSGLHDRRVLVTGASRGLGRAICERLVAEGAIVVATASSEGGLHDLARHLPGITTIVADLSNTDDVDKLANAALPLYGLVNCAGIAITSPFLETDIDDFDRTFRINVRAVMKLSQSVAKRMATDGGGSIVNISSICGSHPLRDHASYCTSKAALEHLSRCMALELGKHGIRVNCIAPTITMTDMGRRAWSDPVKAKPMMERTPLGRFAEPEDTASAVVYLLSPQSGMVHGQTIAIDGGFLIA
ncbi:unnamed protein product (mitochondrion) [Plasmodiophora brassicae]|uniref:Ketoreductase domain-containing protein n=1 Tax=Plasmodiophora brassicae TaxID=37360 RepID=A0A3P3Y4J0_PLABS|nr:unnamed protein product [Plasmodiophora brassicae]